MKKLAVFLLCFSFAILPFTACSSENQGTQEEKQETVLEVDQMVTVADVAEVTYKKSMVAKRIDPPNPSSFYTYYEAEDGFVFFDMVMDIKNLAAESVDAEDIISGSVAADSGSYEIDRCWMESENGGDFAVSASLDALEQGRMHIVAKVKEGDKDFKALLKIGEQELTVNYNAETTVFEKKPIALNEAIAAEDFGEITVLSAQYLSDIVPSNPGYFYSHYQVDDASKIYIDVKVSVKNLGTSKKDVDNFFGISAIYDGKYNYNGFTVLEEADGSDFNTFASLDPLETGTIHGIVEIPTEAQAGPVEVKFYFDGEEYYYTMPQ